jgi:hypothetical protein
MDWIRWIGLDGLDWIGMVKEVFLLGKALLPCVRKIFCGECIK